MFQCGASERTTSPDTSFMQKPTIETLGSLISSGYKAKSIRAEMRDNLVAKLRGGAPRFEGVIGYDNTVLPDVERAILSQHSMLLLGLRGQAKTRIARQMVGLLDEWVPVIAGSELNDDPLAPLSRFGKELVEELGGATPVSWLHRSERYVEKLATPDVSVADLIGDVDPIKASNLRLNYSDERVIHFGLVPRAHRCIFVINELPDLQARIQVSLFNILQEGDIQIRGFKMRLPLDIAFVFTANPEDYTNRGSIITPLKDRIESQILTHYIDDLDLAQQITAQEAKISADTRQLVKLSPWLTKVVDQIVLEARLSELVDTKSGVSPRLSISATENLYSAAERRLLLSGDTSTHVRAVDLWGVVPAITGKVELVYEGEQQGPLGVALSLITQAIGSVLEGHLPNPSAKLKKGEKDPYAEIRNWFGQHVFELPAVNTDKEHLAALNNVGGLRELVVGLIDPPKDEIPLLMEMVLFYLANHDVLQRFLLRDRIEFKDQVNTMWRDLLSDDL